MVNKCKHQWDYINTFREGKSLVAMDNPLYAKWVCPKCKKILNIELDKGCKPW